MGFLTSLGMAVLVSVLELVVISIFVKRVLAKRDAARWMPFRRYLLQVLHDESLRAMEIGHELFEGLNEDLQKAEAGASRLPTFRAMIDQVNRGTETFMRIRTAVHQAIQTAAPSITPETAVFFTNIFRALDNAPIRGEFLLSALEQACEESPESEETLAEVYSQVQSEAIKILGGLSYLADGVQALLEHEGYTVLQGLVPTAEDVERYDRINAAAEAAR